MSPFFFWIDLILHPIKDMEVGDNLGGEEGLKLLLIFEGGAIKDT